MKCSSPVGFVARLRRSIAGIGLVLVLPAASVAAEGEDQETEGVEDAQEVPKPGPSLDIYGFAMLDSIYDFQRTDPNWDATLRPSTIPVVCEGPGNTDEGCGRNSGNMIFSVRQSRFGVKGHMPTAIGQIDTIFEFELFGVGGNAGETTFRLRHAYGELGQFGAGQTWSLFMDIDVFPNTIDY